MFLPRKNIGEVARSDGGVKKQYSNVVVKFLYSSPAVSRSITGSRKAIEEGLEIEKLYNLFLFLLRKFNRHSRSRQSTNNQPHPGDNERNTQQLPHIQQHSLLEHLLIVLDKLDTKTR